MEHHESITFERVKSMIAECTGCDIEHLALHMRLSDLGMDDIALFALINTLKGRFGLRCGDRLHPSLTIYEAIDCLQGGLQISCDHASVAEGAD